MTINSNTTWIRMSWWMFSVMLVVSAAIMWRVAQHENRQVDRSVVVCIDPGHPSETNSGQTLQYGVTEAGINWEVAEKVRSILAKDTRVRVVMTRKSADEFVRNHDRALLANRENACLSVHLHCDAGPSHGYTIYYPDRSGRCEGKTGPSTSVITSSKAAAENIHSAMFDSLNQSLRDRGVRGESRTRIGRIKGALTVSVWSKVPSVTIEMVFLSNRNDAEFIKSEYGQWQMAEAIANGIRDYIKPQLVSLNK